MNQIKTVGLVLRSYNIKEYDKLYLLYTKGLGKVLARAYGARRMKNLVSGHLEPYLMNELLLSERNGHYTIVDTRTSERYFDTSFEQVARLHLVTELIQGFTELYEPDERLFDAIRFANKLVVQDCHWQLSFLEALAKVLSALGIAPSTIKCVISGEKIKNGDNAYWSSISGGLVLKMLNEKTERGLNLEPIKNTDSLKLLHLLSQDIEVAHRLKASNEVLNEAQELLINYIQMAVQTKMRALPFLHNQSV